MPRVRADPALPRVLLLGSTGQIGGELLRTLAPIGTVVAPNRAELDLTNLDAVRRFIRAAEPALIVNAAAYTAVDAAESDESAAFRLNADLPALLAAEGARLGTVLVHYSTDYVFDGKASHPYTESDATAPLNAYGRSKLAGDEAILASGAAAFIFRVAWVYGLRGKNFLRTIQRLASEREELRVVDDQLGGPTCARQIAEVTRDVIMQALGASGAGRDLPSGGLYHLAPPDHTSWFGFAEAIVAARPEGTRPRVVPVRSAEYPTQAARPRWSVMDGSRLQGDFGVMLPPWRTQLARCLGRDGDPA